MKLLTHINLQSPNWREQCADSNHLALEADLTSGVLRFNNPDDLTRLVRLTRTIIENKLLHSRDCDFLSNVANVNIPGDDLD